LTKIFNASSHFPTSDAGLSGQNELNILIKECIAQSRSAQKKLYDHYSPEVYGIIKKFVHNNEQVAKETLNDAFFKIFRDLHQYSFQGSFKGWMRSIVVNTIADNLRKKIKYDQQHTEIQPEDAYINSEPVENLSHKELLKLIETLPEAQREVFNLFVFENYSHKEISKLLNINQNNCRWHLNDARRRLKEKINSITKNKHH
jgi:RNA polymerase sigma factor (sigma-70 family)